MKRKWMSMIDTAKPEFLTALGVCMIFFISGTVAGGMLAGRSKELGAVNAALGASISAEMFGRIRLRNLAGCLWSYVRFPVGIFLGGLSVLGLVLIPALCAVCGFVLGYTEGVLVRLYGVDGVYCALLSGALWLFPVLPCLMALAARALMCALSSGKALWGRGYGESMLGPMAKSFLWALVCAVSAGVMQTVLNTIIVQILGDLVL